MNNLLGFVSLHLILSILLYKIGTSGYRTPLEKTVRFFKAQGMVLAGFGLLFLNMLAMNWLYSVLFIGTSLIGQ